MNEPTLSGSQSIISGLVRNTSDEAIDAVTLSLELTGRDNDVKEIREVQVKPSTLAPGEEGKYSLTVSNHDWRGSKVVSIKSAGVPEGLAFTTETGAKRPPERMPEGKTIVVKKPRPKGEEFLNSPDDADPIR